MARALIYIVGVLALIFWPVSLTVLALFMLFWWVRWKLGFGPKRDVTSTAVLSSEEAGADARRIWRKMRRNARPTLLIAAATDPTVSKMGGNPDLPLDVEWPRIAFGPMGFALQVDLAEVHAAGGPEWLPETGILFIFYDDPSDSGEQVRVLHAEDIGRYPRDPPPDLPSGRCHPERRVKFLKFRSIPSLDWLGEDVREIDVSDEELDALASAPDEPFGDNLQHRIGGYPSEIQEERMAVCAEYVARGLRRDSTEPLPGVIARSSRDWRLLLQIDSDPALKMSWGDAGRLYVFVREGDARAADFSKTVTIWQTH